ncbi:MAG: DUF5667 domain-containing protein [Candidatus Micrarchaeia archaeon]
MKNMMLLLMAFCLLAVPVFAEETGNQEAVDAAAEEQVGALPGEIGYGFQRFFEDVDLFLTFDKAEKAKKHAGYGKLRAMEAQALAEEAQEQEAQGNADKSNKLMKQAQVLAEEHAHSAEEAHKHLEEALEEGNADEEDVEEVESELHTNIVVLQGVYEKVPEPAKESILMAINNSIANQERHEAKVQAAVRKGPHANEDAVGDLEDVDEELEEEETEESEAGNGQGAQVQANESAAPQKGKLTGLVVPSEETEGGEGVEDDFCEVDADCKEGEVCEENLCVELEEE